MDKLGAVGAEEANCRRRVHESSNINERPACAPGRGTHGVCRELYFMLLCRQYSRCMVILPR